MAEFLIRRVGHECLYNQVKNSLTYQRGDIIRDYPDGTCKEDLSPDNPHCIIKVPGLDYPTEYVGNFIFDFESSDIDTNDLSMLLYGNKPVVIGPGVFENIIKVK